MTTRPLPVLPVLLLSAAVSSQYTGEGPVLTRPVAEEPGMRPATLGLRYFQAMTSRAEPGGSRYFVVSGAQSETAPFRLKAWRLSASRTWTPLTDLDAITRDGDQEVSLSHDLLALAVFRAGVGMELLTRPSTSVPFQTRRPITGLSLGAYAPALALIGNSPKLLTCTMQPPAIEIFDLSYLTASAYNRLPLGPRLASSTTHWVAVRTVDDPRTGEARGLIVGEGANASYHQRWSYASSVHPPNPLRPFLDAPRDNRLFDPTQLEGGSFLFTCLSMRATSQFPETVLRADMLLAFDQDVPRTPAASVDVLTPSSANDFNVTLLFGIRGQQGLAIPGITGKLALDPSLIVPLPVQRANNGVGTWTLNLSQVPSNVTVDAQPFGFDSNGYFLGADSWLRTY
jgi:hypothetical protein